MGHRATNDLGGGLTRAREHGLCAIGDLPAHATTEPAQHNPRRQHRRGAHTRVVGATSTVTVAARPMAPSWEQKHLPAPTQMLPAPGVYVRATKADAASTQVVAAAQERRLCTGTVAS